MKPLVFRDGGAALVAEETTAELNLSRAPIDAVEVGRVLDFAENPLLNTRQTYSNSLRSDRTLSHTLEFSESMPGPQDCSPSVQLLSPLAKTHRNNDTPMKNMWESIPGFRLPRFALEIWWYLYPRSMAVRRLDVNNCTPMPSWAVKLNCVAPNIRWLK